MDSIVAWTNRTPGFTRSRYGWTTASGKGPAEHHVELREAEDEAFGLVDEHDLDRIAELVGQPRRQLQPSEARSEHQDLHRPLSFSLPVCEAPDSVGARGGSRTHDLSLTRRLL